MSIKTKMLIFLLIATILPSIIVIVLFQSKTTDMLIEKNISFLTNAAISNTHSVSKYFEGLESNIFNIKTNARVLEFLTTVNTNNYRDSQNQRLTTGTSEKLEMLLQLYSNAVSVCIFPSEDGIALLRGEYDPMLLSSYKQNDTYIAAMQNIGETIWTLTQDKSGGMILGIAAGIADQYSGKPAGCLVFNLDAAEFLSESNTLANSGIAYVVTDQTGNIIYKQDLEIPDDSFTKIINEYDKNETMAPYKVPVNDEKFITVQSTSLSGKWKLYYLWNETKMTDEVNKLFIFTVMLIGIFAVFAIVGAIYLNFKIYPPIKKLTTSMQKIDEGTLDLEVPVEGNDEISLLSRSFNKLIKQVKELLQKTEETQRKKTEMEIRALQAQITPHFLYNTLNSIKALARLNRTKDIIEMIGALIDLLRLSASKLRLITVNEEIDYVKAYMKIMLYRFGKECKLKTSVDPKLESVLIPKFTFQPIVENSIIHGLSDVMNEEPTIWLDGTTSEGIATIIVSDNGKGITDEKAETLNKILNGQQEQEQTGFSGIGIGNIKQRLVLEFGNDSNVYIKRNSPNGTMTILTFPIKQIDN